MMLETSAPQGLEKGWGRLAQANHDFILVPNYCEIFLRHQRLVVVGVGACLVLGVKCYRPIEGHKWTYICGLNYSGEENSLTFLHLFKSIFPVFSNCVCLHVCTSAQRRIWWQAC